MNKALHVFVYLFLILAGLSLWFEYQLNSKRALLVDRSDMQAEYLTKIAGTIENEEADKTAKVEILKDVGEISDKAPDSPETENILEDYKYYLEQQSLSKYEWHHNADVERQLRRVYLTTTDEKGNEQIVMLNGKPQKYGAGTEDELLGKLFKSCQDQQTRLNDTRAALTLLRGKLEDVVSELNRHKGLSREDKAEITKRGNQISKLENIKTDLENQIVKTKAQIDELNAEITSLKDEVAQARDDAEMKTAELAKSQKLVDQLTKMIRELSNSSGSATERGTAVKTIPTGDKGKLVEVDTENMFAVVEFTPEAMKELKGNDLTRPLPFLELGVRRTGFSGAAGEFVGRIRLRQEVAGKNFVICDILSNWEQGKLALGDVVFAD